MPETVCFLEILAEPRERFQRLIEASTQEKQISAIVCGLVFQLSHSQFTAHLFGSLVHGVGFVEPVEPSQDVTNVMANLCDSLLVSHGLENLSRARVVLMGLLVLVEPLINVADIGA